ncbi:MGMT family protein [Leucothrix mucor]|uniref:MGMT family protein n=1 Tax=Leucothrix mucor TaxID=45248 RepID=UPI0003B46573|nr:MGMT family protein [Leucothrix mucor]
MSEHQAKFDTAIWAVVSAIPRGQVMAYREVARAAGFPRHARMVSKAMGRSPKSLPWHRVVRSDRSLAFEVGSEGFDTQRQRLELEGVTMLNGKVIAEQPSEDLDALIWGPE